MTDFSDLQTLEDLKPSGNAAQKTGKYPCHVCGGSGKWKGGINRYGDSKCFACKGKGYFKTSPKQRQQSKKSYQKQKATKKAENERLFASENEEIHLFLVEQATNWKDGFCQSLLEGIRKYGDLTEAQLNAVYEKMARIEDIKKRSSKPAAEIDLSAVREKFEAAFKSGIKRPVLRVNGFVLNRAPDNGKNPGCIYVKDDDDMYLGKVTQEGKFFRSRDCSQEHINALTALSSNVLEAAVAYGRKTGRCSCCGRELTNSESIKCGIGPICADRWGM